MENIVIGYYNELEYYITLNDEQIYRAGNSPFESQTYVSEKDGVERRKMRSYCIITSKSLAKEHNAKYCGVKYEEPWEVA